MGVEGSLCNCIQEVRVLGKVAVVALGADLIVLLHSSGKGCRLHTDVLGQLFDGVGAVPAVGALGTSSLCGLKVALHGFHHSGHVVLECLMAGEAAQDLGLIGAVVDGGDIAALCTCHEEAVDLRAGKGFVLEALAILVHPQGAGQIVGHGHGVEVHGGDVALQTAACPHTHLDGGAVAAKGSKEVLILGEQTLDVRQQIVHHFLVAAKAAACQHNAILSVDLEIIAVAVLCDHAGDLCTVHYQLHTLGAKQSGGIVREILLHILTRDMLQNALTIVRKSAALFSEMQQERSLRRCVEKCKGRSHESKRSCPGRFHSFAGPCGCTARAVFLPATWYWWQEFCFYHEYAVSRKPLIYRRLPAHLLWIFYVDAIRVLDRNKKFHVIRLGISW